MQQRGINEPNVDGTALFACLPGRDLRFAPAWTCSQESILFDASSGDYWVLSTLARRLMQELLGVPSASIDALTAACTACGTSPTRAALEEALETLAYHRLVYQCGRPALGVPNPQANVD